MECNDAALKRLYRTGAYYFALMYPGSNLVAISRLLRATHLKQGFLEAAKAVSIEHLTLGERSYLGTLLPEALIRTLEAGAEKFAEDFTTNLDTPEVIWRYVCPHLNCLPSSGCLP